MRRRILLVARHPVGGILTFFKYMYSQRCFDSYDFTVIAPDTTLQTPLEKIFGHCDFKFISCNSNYDMIKSSLAYIKTHNVSLVHSHGIATSILMVPVTKYCRVPHLLTSHDVFLENVFYGYKGKIKRLFLSVIFSFIDSIHTVGYEATDNLTRFFPKIRKEKISCIPNGIDTEEFFFSKKSEIIKEIIGNEKYIIGFFGRFMSQKGFKYLIEAIEFILKNKLSDKNVMVLTYGWGGYIREEYQVIEDKGLKDHFYMMPHTEDMPTAIKNVDLVVMPSLWEACPLLAMESLVAGVPIVGTNCIGLNEVLSGSPATMVKPMDAVSLANAIAYEMNNERKDEFAEYSSVAKERFSLVFPSTSLKNLYDLLIG